MRSKKAKSKPKVHHNRLPKGALKYLLYENSVQDPKHDIHLLHEIAGSVCGRPLYRLREDFCGTFQFSRTWVTQSAKHTAIGLDLDPEPIAFGQAKSRMVLTDEERGRLKVFRRDVMSVTKPKADLIVAANFSFYVFKTREALKKYFTCARLSLKPNSAFMLEMGGGPGFVRELTEKRVFAVPGIGRFRYVWEQRSFNPITHEGIYAIHFEEKAGRRPRKMKDAFVYDWRVWSIPEVREALREAGFKDVRVYAEKQTRGGAEYVDTIDGDNDESWITYVIGAT